MKMYRTNNKLIITIIAMVLLLVTIMGCSAGNNATNSTTSTPEESPDTSDVNVNFPSRDITYVVPVPPGGGIDAYSRIIARGLEKYLPNDVNVVVKNVPGGDFAIGINEVFNAKPDGYTIGTFLGGSVLNQVLGRASYDLSKMNWIGSIGSTPLFGAVNAESPYKSFEDLQQAPNIKFGLAGGFSAPPSVGALIASKEMELKLDFIPHKGTAETVLATQRGDIDFNISTYVALQGAIESKDIVPIISFSKERFPKLPDVPTAAELGYPEITDIILTYYLIGATPGLPKDASDILSDALQKSLSDPQVISELEKANLSPEFLNSDETMEIINNYAEIFEREKALLQEYIK